MEAEVQGEKCVKIMEKQNTPPASHLLPGDMGDMINELTAQCAVPGDMAYADMPARAAPARPCRDFGEGQFCDNEGTHLGHLNAST